MPEIGCPNCGARLNAPEHVFGRQVTCGQCKHQFTAQPLSSGPADPPGSTPQTPASPGPAGPSQAPPLPAPSPYQSTVPYGYAPARPTSGSAIGAMVLGILSLVMCFAYGLPGLICGIIALVLAGKAQRQINDGLAGGEGMAKAGRICGIIGVILSSLYMAFMIFAIVMAFSQGGF